MTKQGKTIARRVARFDDRKRENEFQKYSVYIDELERAEKTDIWIVSNKMLKNRLVMIIQTLKYRKM